MPADSFPLLDDESEALMVGKFTDCRGAPPWRAAPACSGRIGIQSWI